MYQTGKHYFAIIDNRFSEEFMDGTYPEKYGNIMGHLLTVDNVFYAQLACKNTWLFPRQNCFIHWHGERQEIYDCSLEFADSFAELFDLANKFNYGQTKKGTVEKALDRHYVKLRSRYPRHGIGKIFTHSKHSYNNNSSRNLERLAEEGTLFWHSYTRDKGRYNELNSWWDFKTKANGNGWKKKKVRHQWQKHNKN